MVIGYLQTDQNEDIRRRQELVNEYAISRGYKIDVFYSSDCIDILRSQSLSKGDAIFVYEVACLGNKLQLIKENIGWWTDKGVSVFSAKEDYAFISNATTRRLLEGVGLAVDMRKSMMSTLTAKALAKVKSSGKKLGQTKGRRIKHLLDGKEKEICRLLACGISKAEIARQMGVSYLTLFNFIKQNRLEPRND